MKKNHLLIVLLFAAFVILPGSSVWEGAAAVSADFPESGFYVATNSFPRNTIVDLTNLETGKTVRVIVAASLDTPGLLALVSREAAEAVGLRSRTIGRIRMAAPSDPVAFSRFSENYRSGDPDYDPLAAVNEVYGTTPDSTAALPAAAATETTTKTSDSSYDDIPIIIFSDTEKETGSTVSHSDGPLRNEPESMWTMEWTEPENKTAETYVNPSAEPSEKPFTPAVASVEEKTVSPSHYTHYHDYTLIPAEERPPQEVPSAPIAVTPERKTEPAKVIASDNHVFSVPVVSGLERGKYYLQLGAYSHTAVVEQELSKIGRGYSLFVQPIVSSNQPVYRILIGPVSQGEAGTLLRNFKAKGYKDAFVRRGD